MCVINIIKQAEMLLKLENRQNQMFLAPFKPFDQFSIAFCGYCDLSEDKSQIFCQKTSNQQKLSLKKWRPSINLHSEQAKTQLITSSGKGNSKNIHNKLIPSSIHTHSLRGRFTNSRLHPSSKYRQETFSGILMCKSQSNFPENQHYPSTPSLKSLPFQYSHANLENTGNISSPIRKESIAEMISIKENQKIDQTTCMELQSQQSFHQNFGRPVSSTKILASPQSNIFQNFYQNEEGNIIEGEEEWSDESLSSETKVRFNQINEQQSISESCSTHQKNKVVVNHGNHTPIFQEFRKAHTICSDLSHDDDSFSGHSIVLDRQHNHFLAPGRKFERNEAWHFGHVDV